MTSLCARKILRSIRENILLFAFQPQNLNSLPPTRRYTGMYSPCGQSYKYIEPMTIMEIGMTTVTPTITPQPT